MANIRQLDPLVNTADCSWLTNTMVLSKPTRSDVPFGGAMPYWCQMYMADSNAANQVPYLQSFDFWTPDGAPANTFRHMGNPRFHPTLPIVLFQVQRWVSGDVPPWSSYVPGGSYHNDLWAANVDGSNCRRLYRFDTLSGRLGCLQPHFSRDGNSIVWSNMVLAGQTSPVYRPYGQWEIAYAPFSAPFGVPTLGTVTTVTPAGPVAGTAFYECHGTTADSSKIIFTSNCSGQLQSLWDIYEYNIATTSVVNLTNTAKWSEHAFESPAGDAIIYMSLQDNYFPGLGADIFTMNLDGSAQRHLCWINYPPSPEWLGLSPIGWWVAGPMGWEPRGDRALVAAIGYIGSGDPRTGSGPLLMIEGIATQARRRATRTAPIVRTPVTRAAVTTARARM